MPRHLEHRTDSEYTYALSHLHTHTLHLQELVLLNRIIQVHAYG